MNSTSTFSGFVLLTILFGTGSVGAFAQAARTEGSESVMAVPAPVVFAGTPTCADVNASSNPAFAHIETDWGLRINRSGTTPFNELFSFINGPSTELMGGAAPSPGSFARVAVGGATMSWDSNRAIGAVIVQGPSGANVYPYNPPSLGGFPDGDGSALFIPGSCAIITSVTFCYQSLQPTAAPVSVGGRVVTSAGRGISGAILTITNGQTGATATATTNSFGYYSIDDLQVGHFYVLTVSHRSYTFANDTQTFSLHDSVTGANFVANP